MSVSEGMLPLHCPQPGTTLWNSHPRVFIPVEDNGHARCPYCGTEFVYAAASQPVTVAEATLEADNEIDSEAVDIFGG